MCVKQITGFWKSYKSFLHKGQVRLHEAADCLELSIDAEGALSLHHSGARGHTLGQAAAGGWDLRIEGHRRYLYVGAVRLFEVVTFEATDVVLLDPRSGEKFFFASPDQWEQLLHPHTDSDDVEEDSITLWSRSLISCVRTR